MSWTFQPLTRGTCSHLSETDGNLLLTAFFMTFSLQLTRRPMFSPMQSILSVFCQRRVLFVCAGDKWVRAVPALTGRPGLRYYLQLQQRIQLPEAAWPPGACSTQCTLQPGTHKHLFISTNRLTGDFTPVMSVLHKVHKPWAGHTRADTFLLNVLQVIFYAVKQSWGKIYFLLRALFKNSLSKEMQCVILQK